jgi:FkbM family methyltransferase
VVTRRIRPRAHRILRLVHSPTGAGSIRTTVQTAEGVRFLVNTASHLEWEIFFFGGYEHSTIRLLKQRARPDGLAIDVGANIGSHAIPMAKAMRTGRVLAFEPNPFVFPRLIANLALNPDCNVDARAMAIGNRIGQVDLFIPQPDAGNLGQASVVENSNFNKVAVPCTTLDSLLEDEKLGTVDVLKIDVEGFEWAVIEGARTMLARDHPLIVFEYNRDQWERAGQTLTGVTNSLRAMGYTDFSMAGRRALASIPANPPMLFNVVATRK